MFGHINNGNIIGDSMPSEQVWVPQSVQWPSQHTHHSPYEFNSASEANTVMSWSDAANSSSSGHNSPISFTSSYNVEGQSSVMQRSFSSHNGFSGQFPDDIATFRRAFSAEDLHRINRGQQKQRTAEQGVLSESNAIIEGMNRACKYSPEEKKERIERYRTKRNLRNFNKRIKYECRKTLADSRPRIRGRFARNDEIEKHPQVEMEWKQILEEEDGDVDDDTWINFLHSLSANQLIID